MTISLDQILPSLQALGVLGYWLIGLGSMLEAFFLSGIVIPGTLIVDAGGILVQRGLLDFFDLTWFVAIGSVLGSEFSYWTGKLAMNNFPGRRHIADSTAFARAKQLFERRGGVALVIGRFLGPVAGLVPLAAGMAGMNRRQFFIWNIAGSIPYALIHVAIGYFLGDVMGRIGGSLTRIAVLIGVVGILLIVLWSMLYSALRLLPLAWAVVSAVLHNLAEMPVVARQIEAHPEAMRWAKSRIDPNSFTGLTLSLLVVIFIYIAVVWLDSVIEFMAGDPLLQLDMRLAELIYHFQSPIPIRIASWATAVGSWQVVLPMVASALAWLLLQGHRAHAIGLAVAVIGNTVSVALLKHAFSRPRSPLGFFAETSGSFPSGHAAASVAAYGTIFYVIWRVGKMRAETVLLLASLLAFAIGLSRIYLIEHYLSDVLNGWLVGALWVTVGVAVTEWRMSQKSSPPKPMNENARTVGLVLVLGLVGLACVNAWRYDHPRNVSVRMADQILPDPNSFTAAGDFPAVTESLMGSPIHPISLIVFTKDESSLSKAILASGWVASRLPTLGLVFDAIYAAIEGSEDPTIETVSHFWRGRPNDLAFVLRSPSSNALSYSNSKARFWRTEYVTREGQRAFVGTVGVDEAGNSTSGQYAVTDLIRRDDMVKELRSQGAGPPIHVALPLQIDILKPAQHVDAIVLSLP